MASTLRARRESTISASRRATAIPTQPVDAYAEGEVSARVARDVEAVRIFPAPGIAIGGGQEEEHLFALTVLHPSDLDGARGRAEECLHWRLVPEHLVECGPRQRGLLSQPLPLLRMLREAEEGVAEADYRGVETCGEERSHEQRRLFLGELARVGRRVDLGTQAPRREGGPLAPRYDPAYDRLRVGHRLMEEIIAGG
jgi:hypothetical protein